MDLNSLLPVGSAGQHTIVLAEVAVRESKNVEQWVLDLETSDDSGRHTAVVGQHWNRFVPVQWPDIG